MSAVTLRPELLIERVEADQRADPLIEWVHGLVRRILDRVPGRQLLSGTGLGHPAHPVFVAGPIGCFVSAALADLRGQNDAACFLTAAGLVATVPTAATGL